MSGISGMMLANFAQPIIGGAPEPAAAGYIAFTGGTSPFQQFYEVDSGNANSYDLISGQPNITTTTSQHFGSGAWHPAGTHYCVVAASVVAVYERSGFAFTKLSTSATASAFQIGGCVWSRDGQWVATGSNNGILSIYKWDGTNLINHQTISGLGPNPMWSCAFNVDSTRIVVCGDSQLRLVALTDTTWAGTGTAFATGVRHFDCDHSLDGSRLVSVDIAGAVRIFTISGDTYTLSQTMSGGGSSGRAVAFSPDSQLILVNGALRAHGWNGSTFVTVTAPTNGVASDKRMLSFNGAGTHFTLKPDSGQPRMWSISGTGSDTTFTYITAPFTTDISTGNAGGGMFIDSPQNF